MRHSTWWIKPWRFILRRDSHPSKNKLETLKVQDVQAFSKYVASFTNFFILFPQVSCSMFSLFRWNSRTWARCIHSHPTLWGQMLHHPFSCFPLSTRKKKTSSDATMPHLIAIGVLLFEFSTWRCRYLSWEQWAVFSWPCVCWLISWYFILLNIILLHLLHHTISILAIPNGRSMCWLNGVDYIKCNSYVWI